MVGIGFIAGIAESLTKLWSFGEKIRSKLPKRVAPKIHNEEEFLALIDQTNRTPIRHIDITKHYYRFMVYVDEVVFEQRLIRHDLNRIVFRFSDSEQKPGVLDLTNQQWGNFGKRLRDKAKMLKKGDLVIIRGYFSLQSIFGIIFITDIERP